jgi:cytochrome P450
LKAAGRAVVHPTTTADATLADAHSRVAAYYTDRVKRFGATPRGVDWTCQATQEMRFVQLLKLCDLSVPCSLNDFGCGYGALASFVTRRHPSVQMDYLGIDLSEAMIRRARRRNRGVLGCRFAVGHAAPRLADYSVASGVMNVQLDFGREEWEALIAETLRAMRRGSRRGFAVNFLDLIPTEPASQGLYRTEALPWVEFCRGALACSTEIVRGYGMREFTLVARPDREWSEQISLSVRRSRRTSSARARTCEDRKVAGSAVTSDPRREAVQAAASALLSPEDHADEVRIHAAFRVLRREAPVYWVALPRVKPFWAVTRYHDVLKVERKGAGFIVGPRTQLGSEAAEMCTRQLSGKEQLLRTLAHMDEPDHGPYRAIAQPWFLPPALAGLKQWMGDWAKECVDKIADHGGGCDFAAQVAVPFTLRIITRILGIPESDEPQFDRLVRGIVGPDDPWRQFAKPPANPVHEALRGCRDYFDALAADRNSCPRADLASVIANATINGVPLPQFERVSYYVVLAIGGYDTTSFALSGGLHALIEHPDQLARLQRDPSALDSTIEEILRWTAPSRHFVRTATKDTELGGQRIRAGEAVAIFFASANRDEAVFADADSFSIDRAPNPHITFGRGAHYCLGQALARMELRAFFGELLPRLRSVEIAGPTRRAHSIFLTGFTSLPLRFQLK